MTDQDMIRGIEEIPVTRLIRQRPPFVMVDCLRSCDTAGVVTQLTVRPDNMFLDGDGITLSAPGIIENMAQSCAARMGLVSRDGGQDASGDILQGVIGEIRDAVVLRQPRCGETMLTRVSVLEEVFNLSLAEVEVTVEGQTIATARMKIALVGQSDEG